MSKHMLLQREEAKEPMTVEECKIYIKQHLVCNHRYKCIEKDTAGDVDQFNTSRIRKDLKPKPEPDFKDNIYDGRRVLPPKKIWHKNRDIDSVAVANTFKYIFYKFKKGIFIRIADNKVQTFLPFKNVHYKNEFGHVLVVDPKYGSINDFLNYVSKLLGYRPNRQNIKPVNEWIANNSLIRYDEQDLDPAISSNNKTTFIDMFRTLCKEREVPDIEFFINKRDYPQMKVDDTEPYNHIWDSKHKPLVSHKYPKYAPILSGSSTKMNADIPFPTYEDWARVIYQRSGLVFPNSCREYPDVTPVPWNAKMAKAVFRGATTGSGTTPQTNQRLRAFEIGEKHKDLMDIGITKWNLRPRKLEGSKYLQTIERKSYPIATKLDLQQQCQYKYILNLEGHVAAYRLSYELSSGSVVLLAGSEWEMWYYPFLKAYEHYIPVKMDLSDLVSQIEWCKANDGKCQEIANNARAFYNKYLGFKGILDFLQKELWEISAKTKPYRYLPDLIIWSIEDEGDQLGEELKFTNTSYKFNVPESPRCIGILDAKLKVMRSKSIKDLAVVETILINANGKVIRFRVNGFDVVGKKANHEHKTLEHVHESYIGLKAINKMVARTPNFAYVFGPLKDAPEMVFVEHIKGLSLMNWLKSPQYKFKDFISILVQLNLALSVAQNYIGFIHYDLYPWNVMIQAPYDGQTTFSYFLNFSGNKEVVVKLTPTIVPVIIDYGKSRAIVYERDHGLIDHGFTNLYQHNQIVDTLTILYGSLNVLKDAQRLGSDEMKLLDFPKRLGLESYSDTKRWGKFGSLFNFQPKTKSGALAVPKNFVDFIQSSFKNAPQLSITKISDPSPDFVSEFAYPMEKGFNPIIAEGFMKYGNTDAARLELIKHMDTSRPARSYDRFFQLIILNMLQRRLGWADAEMVKGTPEIRKKWDVVKKLFQVNQVVESAMPEMDFPKPQSVFMDSEMTPEYVIQRALEAAKIPIEDWMTTWILCLEAFLFGVVLNQGDYGQFIQLNGFLYLNAVASNNSILKLKDKLGL